jgi:hypothetical protein
MTVKPYSWQRTCTEGTKAQLHWFPPEGEGTTCYCGQMKRDGTPVTEAESDGGNVTWHMVRKDAA